MDNFAGCGSGLQGRAVSRGNDLFCGSFLKGRQKEDI